MEQHGASPHGLQTSSFTSEPLERDSASSTLSAEGAAHLLSHRVLQAVRQPLLVLDADLSICAANPAFYSAFQVTPEETLDRPVASLGNGQWGQADLQALLEGILPTHMSFEGFEVVHTFPTLGLRTMMLYGREVLPVPDAPRVEGSDAPCSDARPLILLVFEDVTERRMNKTRRDANAARERRVADGLRRALMQPIPTAAFSDLAVVTAHEFPQNESLGGDFFDAFALSSGSVALIMGDVEGHGLAAAMHIGEIKYVLRALLREDPDPAFALSRLNDIVCTGNRLDGYAQRIHAVVSLVLINQYTWNATFTRAGAEPPLILKENGTWKAIEAGGMMLGVREEATYPTEALLLERGDTLMMMTDGVTEARASQAGPFFGPDRAVKSVQEALRVNGLLTDEPLRDVGQTVLGAVLAFASSPLTDDASLLLARRRQPYSRKD